MGAVSDSEQEPLTGAGRTDDPGRLRCPAAAADQGDVLIGVLVLLGFATVPLLGGRLSRLAALRLRLVPVAGAAFAVQIVIVNLLPGGDETLHALVHVATYAVLGLVMVANLSFPGVWLVALGGLSNATAIVANHGVMPASEKALRIAGMTPDPEGFTNSGLVEHARLGFLGDVLAVPAAVPAANVFSVGDLLLVAGCWVLIHRVCGSRPPWRRAPRGPAVVLFDAAGKVEAATPEAIRLFATLEGVVPSPAGVALPPEAFVVAGRARTRARADAPALAEVSLQDGRGRLLRLTGSVLDGAGAPGPRVAVTATF